MLVRRRKGYKGCKRGEVARRADLFLPGGTHPPGESTKLIAPAPTLFQRKPESEGISKDS